MFSVLLFLLMQFLILGYSTGKEFEWCADCSGGSGYRVFA